MSPHEASSTDYNKSKLFFQGKIAQKESRRHGFLRFELVDGGRSRHAVFAPQPPCHSWTKRSLREKTWKTIPQPLVLLLVRFHDIRYIPTVIQLGAEKNSGKTACKVLPQIQNLSIQHSLVSMTKNATHQYSDNDQLTFPSNKRSGPASFPQWPTRDSFENDYRENWSPETCPFPRSISSY